MAKPFSLQELEARARALVRRGMGATSSNIKHGPLTYDPSGRVATIEGKMVELSARELGELKDPGKALPDRVRRRREEIARLRQPTRPTGESTLFVGAKSSYTTSMDFWYPHVDNVPAAMPCFRIMDEEGNIINKKYENSID
jgi:hypothetical protein